MEVCNLQDNELRRFIQLMVEHNLKKYIPIVQPHLERCILLKITDLDDYAQVGNSRRCGWPDFPPGWTWPKSQDGKYLNFLCQLNLEEIAEYQEVLPRKGILYFFMGGQNFECEGQICFYDGDLSLLRKYSLSKSLDVENFSLGFRPDLEEDDSSILLFHYPRKVSFYPALSMPNHDSRILIDGNGQQLKEALSHQEILSYIHVKDRLQYPKNIINQPIEAHDYPPVHQRVFWYQYFQTLELRDFDKYPCSGPEKGVELYCIWDHDEFFQSYLDGSICFVVKQDELKSCDFSEIFVAFSS